MSKSFGRAAVTLAVISIIAKAIGALYRVPLTNTVGAEGMGLYQMVFPLYTTLLAFCGGGMTSAVARVVAKYTARGDDVSAVKTVRAALVPLGIVSVVSAAGTALLRNVISGLQGNGDAAIAYLALSPSLLFAGIISVLRGYFQGKSIVLPSGISQLAEQIVKLALGLYLARVLLPYGVDAAVAGALLGVAASELVAAAYLAVRYFIHRRKRRYAVLSGQVVLETASDNVVSVRGKELIRELYAFALPVTLGSLVLPLTQMIDSALVINLLVHGGADKANATALFGLFVGPVGTLVNVPAVVALSVSVAFLPAITSAVESGDRGKTLEYSRDAAKWIMLLSVPIAVAFFAFPEAITSALYSRGLTAEQLTIAARLLRVQAIGVLYTGVLQLSTAVLQGRNKSHIPVINLVVGACVKVGLTPVLVRFLGIVGASAATAACYGVAAVLSVRAAYASGGVCASVRDAFIVPFLFSAAGALGFWGASMLLATSGLSAVVRTAISAGVFAIIYLWAFLACSGGAGAIKKLRLKKGAGS